MNQDNDLAMEFGKNQAVVSTELDDGGILLDLNKKYYYSLNETGLRIWQLLDECKTPANITELITHEYEIERDNAESCVMELMEELEKNGLIKPKVSR